MGPEHTVYYANHDFSAGHIAPVPEIHEVLVRRAVDQRLQKQTSEQKNLSGARRMTRPGLFVFQENADPAGAGEESPPHGRRPELTVEIPSTNSEDSVSNHVRIRMSQTPVSNKSSRTPRGSNPWSLRLGTSPGRPSPSRGSPYVRKLLQSFSSRFRGPRASEARRKEEGPSLSSADSVKQGSSPLFGSLAFTKLVAAAAATPSSLPVTPVQQVCRCRDETRA